MELKNYFNCVDESAEWIKQKVDVKPRVAVVLSAGLSDFCSGFASVTEINSSEIPNYPKANAEGHSGKLYIGKYSGVSLLVSSGRFHYYEGHLPQSIVFPYFVMAKLGVKVLITTNAVGGVNKSFKAGDVMVVNDHINMMGINPLIGIATQRPSDQFTSLVNAYDPTLRKLSHDVAKKLDISLKDGVYLATSGPSYETKAEIKAYRLMGADAVGMSTVPEIIAANFLGMRCLSFSCIANPSSDRHEGEMSHGEVLEAMNKLAPRMCSLLKGVVKKIGETMS